MLGSASLSALALTHGSLRGFPQDTASNEVLLPALWCCINIVWPGTDRSAASDALPPAPASTSASTSAAGRGQGPASTFGGCEGAARLRELGADALLRELLAHGSQDVCDRARIVLDHMTE